MSDMRIEIEAKDTSIIILNVVGEFMGLSAINFQTTYQTYLDENVGCDIGLRMSDTTYIDSAGIGVLIVCDQIASNTGRSMFIMSPSLKVMKVIKSVKLDSRFKIINT
ncbi:MAG: anti-anti-sigma factor [Candidatus Omnitrophota bacterium]|jgi:anti-anti-sigma factor